MRNLLLTLVCLFPAISTATIIRENGQFHLEADPRVAHLEFVKMSLRLNLEHFSGPTLTLLRSFDGLSTELKISANKVESLRFLGDLREAVSSVTIYENGLHVFGKIHSNKNTKYVLLETIHGRTQIVLTGAAIASRQFSQFEASGLIELQGILQEGGRSLNVVKIKNLFDKSSRGNAVLLSGLLHKGPLYSDVNRQAYFLESTADHKTYLETDRQLETFLGSPVVILGRDLTGSISVESIVPVDPVDDQGCSRRLMDQLLRDYSAKRAN